METEIFEQKEALLNIKEPEKRIWFWLLGTGVFTILLGIAAILLPFTAALTIETLIAAIFMIASVAHILHSFQCRHTKGLVLRLIAGFFYGLVGIILLAFPLQGLLTLTLLLAILFMVAGSFKIALALYLNPLPSWGWLLFSGVISALLGILIWTGLPGTANWAIGLLVGIELLFSGWSMTMSAFSIHSGYKSQDSRKETML